ncbi:unnamed protein product [Symbiodinium natans]|uniref:Uncharacterized protein n=1 Tax=Symbiodinium natans TaxID=878477 RepID=A0A812JLY5_9DINO|nr:unnamed protein product [Symbiodinium natans]
MARAAILAVAALCLRCLCPEDLAFLAARRGQEQPKPLAGLPRAAVPSEPSDPFLDVEEVWAQWDASLPDAETLDILDAMQLPEEWKGAVLVEAVRWAARGDSEWLQRWAKAARSQPSFLEGGEVPTALRPSDLTRLVVQCLAELMARGRQGLLRNELRALVWFLEFMLSNEGRDERQIEALRSSAHEELQAQGRLPFTAVTEGVQGGDLPLCMGDVLTLIHDFCDALDLECPWPRDLDSHLDVLLFVNLVQAFSGRQWKPSLPRSLTATRALQNVRQLILQLPLAQDTASQRARKMARAARRDRQRAEGTALDLAWATDEAEEEPSDAELETSGQESSEAELEAELEAEMEEAETTEEEPNFMGTPQALPSEVEEAAESRELSDVRQRRDARVQWDVEDEEDDGERVPATNGGAWQDLRTAPVAGLLGRATMYMHHITAPWKQKFILQAASRAGLSGRCLFGKPGRILVEGPIEIVAKYTSQIQSWPWKTCNLQGPWQVERRAFEAFSELGSNSEFKKAVVNAGLSQELRGVRSER